MARKHLAMLQCVYKQMCIYKQLLKTGSLNNAIREFSLA